MMKEQNDDKDNSQRYETIILKILAARYSKLQADRPK